MPWRLHIHQMDVETGKAGASLGYFQPTFLYESVWNLLVAGFLIWADRRWKFARGQVFLTYVMAYTAGRFVVEGLRSDTANHILGLRVNSWVSIIVFLTALACFLRQRGKPRSAADPVEAVPPDGAAGGDVPQVEADGPDAEASPSEAESPGGRLKLKG